MTRRPLLALALLPLLMAAWVACPCVYAQWIADARGADAAAPGTADCDCCCCGGPSDLSAADDESSDTPYAPGPCERRSAHNADMPPLAPVLAAPDFETATALVAEQSAALTASVVHVAREALPAPPDVLRRGTVLLR